MICIVVLNDVVYYLFIVYSICCFVFYSLACIIAMRIDTGLFFSALRFGYDDGCGGAASRVRSRHSLKGDECDEVYYNEYVSLY